MAKGTVTPPDFYVYILFRHDTGIPFYIGKGNGDRWNRHEYDKRSETNKHKRSIVAAAKRAGAEIPKVKIATGLTEQAAFELEKGLIASIGRALVGGPLCNLTDGGDGVFGLVHLPERIAKMSAAKKGRALSETHRLNIAAAMNKPEVREKIAKGMVGIFTPEMREKLAAGRRGKKRSPETAILQKLNNPGHAGHSHSDDAKQKISLAFKGKPWSEARRTAQLARKAKTIINTEEDSFQCRFKFQ